MGQLVTFIDHEGAEITVTATQWERIYKPAGYKQARSKKAATTAVTTEEADDGQD